MLPRPSQRSIFHLGEEGGDDHRGADEHVKNIDATRSRGGRQDHGRQRRKRDATAVDAVGVGLQILVQNGHHARALSHSHIVLKQAVVLMPTVARHRRGPCSRSLLSACSRCRRELISSKDVYMYRGDQGFCSEECRRQQILIDEATEREAMVKKERMRRGLPHRLHHGPRSAIEAIGGAPRILATIAY